MDLLDPHAKKGELKQAFDQAAAKPAEADRGTQDAAAGGQNGTDQIGKHEGLSQGWTIERNGDELSETLDGLMTKAQDARNAEAAKHDVDQAKDAGNDGPDASPPKPPPGNDGPSL